MTAVQVYLLEVITQSYIDRAEKNLFNNFLSLPVTNYWNSLPENVFMHQISRHLKVDWTNTGRSMMKENTTTANCTPEHAETNVEGDVEKTGNIGQCLIPECYPVQSCSVLFPRGRYSSPGHGT